MNIWHHEHFDTVNLFWWRDLERGRRIRVWKAFVCMTTTITRTYYEKQQWELVCSRTCKKPMIIIQCLIKITLWSSDTCQGKCHVLFGLPEASEDDSSWQHLMAVLKRLLKRASLLGAEVYCLLVRIFYQQKFLHIQYLNILYKYTIPTCV